MGLVNKLGGALLVAGAALAGNWAGDHLRALSSGQPHRTLRLVHTTGAGETVVGVHIVLTNFVPALLLAWLAGKPRSVYALISGLLLSTLIGTTYEDIVLARLSGRILQTNHRVPVRAF